MTKISSTKAKDIRFGHWILINWDLFGPALAGLGFGYWNFMFYRPPTK